MVTATVRCVDCDVLGTVAIGHRRCWCCGGTNVMPWSPRSAGHRNNPREHEVRFYDGQPDMRLGDDEGLPWQR